MSPWTSQLIRFARFCAGDPATNLQMAITLIIAMIAMVVSLESYARSFKFPVRDSNRCIGVFLVGALACSFAAITGAIYIAPKFASHELRTAVPLVFSAIAIAAVVTPFAVFVFKGSYMKTLSGIFLSIAAAVVAVLMTKAVFTAVRKGEGDLDKTRTRKERMREVL
ncbi:MAG: hypothetical protein JXN60_03335 [Lentisphaerae bacterium]|nr:hypothetical protein [Lentisphaerota bacterium]